MITYALRRRSDAAWDCERLLNAIGDRSRPAMWRCFCSSRSAIRCMLFASECGNFAFRMLVGGAADRRRHCRASMAFCRRRASSTACMFVGFWALAFVILFLMRGAWRAGRLLADDGVYARMAAERRCWRSCRAGSFRCGSSREPVAAVIGYLPFAWVGFYPMAVYLGKLDIGARLRRCSPSASVGRRSWRSRSRCSGRGPRGGWSCRAADMAPPHTLSGAPLPGEALRQVADGISRRVVSRPGGAGHHLRRRYAAIWVLLAGSIRSAAGHGRNWRCCSASSFSPIRSARPSASCSCAIWRKWSGAGSSTC